MRIFKGIIYVALIASITSTGSATELFENSASTGSAYGSDVQQPKYSD